MFKYKGLIMTAIVIITIYLLINIEYVTDQEQHYEENAKLEKITMRGCKKTGIYYIYNFKTSNGEMLSCKNEDSIYCLKFNSGDYEAKLSEGNFYNIKYRGKRIKILSMYPNIMDLESK